MAENKEIKNSENLSEKEVFEKIKEDLNPIQENLSEKKITINEAKSELKKINEWLQSTKLEQKDKKELWEAFNKLTKNLEKNVDENNLQTEFKEVINLLETFTNRELSHLKWSISKTNHYTSERLPEVQEWIEQSSKSLVTTIDEASNDSNIIARTIGKRMKNLIS